MVFRKISPDIKERALWLWDNGYVKEDICTILGVSVSSLNRWRDNLENYNSVVPPPNPRQGRLRILKPDMTHDLYTLLEEAPELYLDEIQEWLAAAHNIGISVSALHENLVDAGITYKLLRKAAAERDEDARQHFRDHAKNHWTANQLVFVDESSKDERTIYRHYGRSVEGERAHLVAPFRRGERYSIVAALGLDGYITQRIVRGSVDGAEFFDFIVEVVSVDLVQLLHCLTFLS
jgi:transposase